MAPETLPQVLEITVEDKEYRWQVITSGQFQSADYSQSLSGMPSNDTQLSRFQLYSVFLQILGPLSTEQRRSVLKQLLQWSGQVLKVRKDYLPMNSAELKTLADRPLFEIGAHTVNHPHLAYLPIQKQEQEINQSKINLENRVNKSIVSFSYPYGSYVDETVKLVKRSKYQNACTVIPNKTMRDTDPYLFPDLEFKIGMAIHLKEN